MPHPLPAIRRLEAGDAALLHQLNDVFAEVFEDPDSYQSARPSDAYLEELLRKDHVIPLIALSGGAVVGGLVAYELDKFEQQRREIYIYDLAVRETHRRRGVATALIQQLCAIARERDAWAIYVQADVGDDPAVALYSKLGRREDVLHFDIDPSPG